MKVLITGGKGLLGSSLIKTGNKTNHLLWTYFKNPPKTHNNNAVYLDLNNYKGIETVFSDFKPDIVIHTAGNGNVDWCEKNKDQAYTINVSGTKNIVLACRKYNSKIIYISSNAVFDGTSAPYNESSLPNPINFYGHTKIICEHTVKAFMPDHVIVRPILMYGWDSEGERSNPTTWLIKMLKENKTVKMVDDIYVNPLYAVDCANIIWKIIEKNKKGTFHLGGRDCINRYEMAIQTARVFGLDERLIEPVKNDYFKDIAPRPFNTCYDTTKMQKELGIKPGVFIDCLTLMKKEME